MFCKRMEKFAVDLEKVLDEFEYNEEREENVSASSIKNPPLAHLGSGALRQLPSTRPPAASYRRPSFEPINLADADFAASPPKSSTNNFTYVIPGKQNENDGTFGFYNNKPQINNRNYVTPEESLVASMSNGVNINKQIIIESEDITSSNIWQKASNSLQSDEKPDLLEYNSKNADFDSNNLKINNQLPDITSSVRTSSHGVNNNELDNLSNSLDLISSASGNLLTGNDEPNCAKTESEFNESATSDNFEKNAMSNYESYQDSNMLDDNNPVNIECPKLVPVVDRTDTLDTSLIQPNTELDTVIVQNDTPIESHAQMELSQPTLSQDDISLQTHNVFSHTGVLSKVNKTETIEENNMTGDCINDSQINFSESSKPIGFSTDSDLSEGELEEYLKELEILDEVLASEEICYKETPADVLNGESAGNTEVNNEIKPFKIGQIDLNDTKMFKSTECENGDCNIRKMEKNCDNNNTETPISSSKSEHMPKTTLLADLSEINTSNPPAVDTTANESFKNASKSSELVSESDNAVNRANNIESKLANISGEVVQSSDKLEEANTNPFHSNNPFDDGHESNIVTNKKVLHKSTNPFDNEDGDIDGPSKSDKTRESTNPFESDIDIDEECIPDSSTSKLEEISTATESQSGGQNLDSTWNNENSSLREKSFSVSDVTSNTEEEISSGLAVGSSQIINNSEGSLGEANVNNIDSDSISEELPANEYLPSCSNLHGQSLDNVLESTVKMIPIKRAIESPSAENVDEAGVVAEEDKPLRPNSLELPRKITVETSTLQSPSTGELERELGPEDRRLGKIAPFWIPDTDTTMCMQCQLKFNVIKRRHHCRACGQVLCYKCCGLKARLEYMNFAEARVCQPCFTVLDAVNASESTSPLGRQPNPNNPMEYCSTIPPLQQAAGSMHQPPPSVMVPVGVLKREGRMKSDVTKQVMFSDGIRPGGDLTELDGSGEPRMPFRRPGRLTKRVGTPPGGVLSSPFMRRVMDPTTHSFIPAEGESSLPPVVSRVQGEVSYFDVDSPVSLNQPTIKFALNRNLFVLVKRIFLDCCVNRECWCFSSEGLACVGQDEVVFLLECLPQETLPPKDVFLLINFLYQDAAKGTTVSEMSFTPAMSNNLLGSRDHGGFLYIRTSYQCTAQLVLPSPPYLVALLIHRWETPWARLFPIRLVLRLGAEFRYYPCPLVSVRNRPPLYTDIGHTIINILADFRKYSYTLPSVRGLVIHMEDRQTTINIPRNRYDQVVRALNNSNDSVLAFGANLSLAADSHLVCMQSTEDENTSYHTQAINIHNKPRKVTGASFVVFNGALKVPGLAGKSNIVEDGLMVQVPSETMIALRTALRDMRDYSIGCGPNAEETVVLQWTADDTNFNIGVKSCIDGKPLGGVPSIRVHNGTDYSGGARIIRWTEVFILQCEDSEHSSEPLDISRLSESIARATCLALVPLLDLLSAASLTSLAVRTTIHPDNVGYEAGSNGEKLPPLYMKSLDDELVAVVHQAALASQENPAVLELVFRIMEQG